MLLLTELRKRSKMLTKLDRQTVFNDCNCLYLYHGHERKLARLRFECRICGGLEDLPGTIAWFKKLYTEKYKHCKEIVALAQPLKDTALTRGGNGKMFGDDEAKLLTDAEEYIGRFEQSDMAKNYETFGQREINFKDGGHYSLDGIV